MNLENIVVNGTDTLGQGVESHEMGYRHTGYRFAITVRERDVIGSDFAEFDKHLNRLLGQGQWTYDTLYSGTFDRRYYFRSQMAVELEPVPLVNPSKPSGVAALVGKDPYTTPGDINFLLKGDRFRAERKRPGGRKEVVYGTAAMDGCAISPDHGYLRFEAEGDTRTAEVKRRNAEDKNSAYINVHWDHREPGDYDDAVQANRAAGIAYKPQGKHWPNEGLALKDGWEIWVTPQVAAQKAQALGEARKRRQRTEAENRLAKAQQAVREANRAVQDAQRKLELAEKELQNG